VEGPRPVGEIAENLGVTSQAVSKAVRELESLGYVDRRADPLDGRVRRVALTERGRAVLAAGRAIRAAINDELASALGRERLEAAAETLREALAARGAMARVETRRVRSAQDLHGEGR
jgi:DNA-binding MarR family transcriptional regulator